MQGVRSVLDKANDENDYFYISLVATITKQRLNNSGG